MSNHTDPFRDTCSAALCLRATAASGGGHCSLGAAGNGPPLSVLLLELLLLVALPMATASSSHHGPTLPTYPPASSEKLAESGTLWPSAGSDPCSTVSLVPGLLIALCRAIGSSTSVSEIRHSLWLNSSNSDTDLTFSRYLLRLESQKRAKEPSDAGFSIGGQL